MTTILGGRAALAMLAALALSACVDTGHQTDTADEVLALAVGCIDGRADCQRRADGHTALLARLCLTTDRDHAATVPATVRTSTGEWQLADVAPKTTTTVDLAGTHCAPGETTPTYLELTLVPGRTTGTARIDATVGAFTASEIFTLLSAELGEVELRPAVYDLGAARTIAVTATVRARHGGAPSAGTRVELAVVGAVPAAALAVVVPSTVEVDALGTATATLQTSSDIVSLTLTATAYGLEVDGDVPRSPLAELPLRDVP